MGLLPGTPVRLVRRADVGGVLELDVRGSRLTVRRGEARLLRVQP
jgi:Fe2+ transport system protein FeoA